MTAATFVLDLISKLMFGLACVLVAGIVVTVSYDVIARNLGLPGIIWAVNSVEYAMLHITFLTFPWLVRTRGHVCVEIVLTYLTPRLRRIWEVALMIASALVSFYLAWRSGDSTLTALLRGTYEVRAFDVPMWILFAPMPVGLALGGLQFLAFLARGESFYTETPNTEAGM